MRCKLRKYDKIRLQHLNKLVAYGRCSLIETVIINALHRSINQKRKKKLMRITLRNEFKMWNFIQDVYVMVLSNFSLLSILKDLCSSSQMERDSAAQKALAIGIICFVLVACLPDCNADAGVRFRNAGRHILSLVGR